MTHEFERLILQFFHNLPHFCRQSATLVFFGLVFAILGGLVVNLMGMEDK